MTLAQVVRSYEREVAQSEATYGAVVQAKRRIGAAMREERQRQGITLRALARQIKCSAAMLSDLERGNRWSNGLMARALAILNPESGK